MNWRFPEAPSQFIWSNRQPCHLRMFPSPHLMNPFLEPGTDWLATSSTVGNKNGHSLMQVASTHSHIPWMRCVFPIKRAWRKRLKRAPCVFRCFPLHLFSHPQETALPGENYPVRVRLPAPRKELPNAYDAIASKYKTKNEDGTIGKGSNGWRSVHASVSWSGEALLLFFWVSILILALSSGVPLPSISFEFTTSFAAGRPSQRWTDVSNERTDFSGFKDSIFSISATDMQMNLTWSQF